MIAWLTVSSSTKSQEEPRQLEKNFSLTTNQVMLQEQNQAVANNVYLGNGVSNPMISNQIAGQQTFPGMNNGANYQAINVQTPASTPMNLAGYPRQYSSGFGHMPISNSFFGQNNGMFGYPGMMPSMMGSPFPGSGLGMMGMPGQMPMGMSGQMPMGMPGQIPMGMPGHVPMGMPGHMPMGMSGRMPMGFPMAGSMPGMPFPPPMGNFAANPAMAGYPSQMMGSPMGFNPLFGGMGLFGGGMGAANPSMMSMGPWAYLSGFNPGFSAQEIKEYSRKLKRHRKKHLNTIEQQPLESKQDGQ